MSSVGYGDFHWGRSLYGTPQYEQASCTISASSGISASPTVQFNLQNETINAQSGLSGSINIKLQPTATSNGVSSLIAEMRRIKLGIPLELLENSGSLSHGTQVDQAETFVQVNSGITSVGNQIDQGEAVINASSGSQQIGIQIDLGQTSLTETSSSANVGTQIDLGQVNPIGVSQTVSAGTQIDLGASASCLPTSNVTTLNPLHSQNIMNVDFDNNAFRVNQTNNYMTLRKNVLNEINQIDSSNVGNTLALSQCPDGHHNTSRTHVSVRTDSNSNTYLQVSGAYNGTTPGGTATNQKRTIYRYIPDSQGGSPTYTGSAWAYVYYQTSSIKDDLVTATIGSVLVNNLNVLTVNGYPAYQFSGDTSKETANGVGGSWEAFEIDGTSQTNQGPGASGSNQTFAVTVATGINAYGSGNKFYLDGSVSPVVNLVPGYTYTFDQSDSSNTNHPLRLSTTANGTHGGGSAYTTQVTTNGTPGTSGAFTKIVVSGSTPNLHYYCQIHSGMGNTANVASGVSFVSDSTIYETGITTTGTVGSNRKLSFTPANSTPSLYYFSLENSNKGGFANVSDFAGVESTFLLVGGSQVGLKSDLFSDGVRRYFGLAQSSSSSGVTSDGGLKWSDQSVPNTSWTEQKQAQ